jgi:hypothetical protein
MRAAWGVALAAMLLILAPATARKPPRGAHVPPPAQEDDGGRIIGGVEIKLGEAPYQVQIFWKAPPTGPAPAWQRRQRCGGALISADPKATETRWVLTAAHCLYSKSYTPATIAANLGVRAGIVRIDDPTPAGAYDVDPAGVFPHPGYIKDPHYRAPGERAARFDNRPELRDPYRLAYTYDLALLRLVKPMPLTRYASIIPIATDPPVPGEGVLVSGWGISEQTVRGETALAGVSSETTSFAQVLKAVPLDVIACTPDAPGAPLPPTDFCAGKDGKDSCTGDSGGPVVTDSADRALVGVVSRRVFGVETCGGKSVQTRYTRIDADMRAWIGAIMKANP